jgi:hypothetical protein
MGHHDNRAILERTMNAMFGGDYETELPRWVAGLPAATHQRRG